MKETSSNNKNNTKINQGNPDLEKLNIFKKKNCFPHQIRRRRTLKCLDQPHLAANLRGVGYRSTQILEESGTGTHKSLSVNRSGHAFVVEKKLSSSALDFCEWF